MMLGVVVLFGWAISNQINAGRKFMRVDRTSMDKLATLIVFMLYVGTDVWALLDVVHKWN